MKILRFDRGDDVYHFVSARRVQQVVARQYAAADAARVHAPATRLSAGCSFFLQTRTLHARAALPRPMGSTKGEHVESAKCREFLIDRWCAARHRLEPWSERRGSSRAVETTGMHPHNLQEETSRWSSKSRQRVQEVAALLESKPETPHILIVEDDADLRQSMVFVLSDEGYVVSDACDGREALHLLEDGLRPNLILLDLMMPNMNGFQFRDAQLRCEEIAAIPVVAWSAHNDPESFVAPLRADGLLRKPFDIPVAK